MHRAAIGAGLPISDLQDLLERDSANPGNWCELGDGLLKAGYAAKARFCYSTAVALGPRIPSALLCAARFHFRMGESQQALLLAARALESNPEMATAVFGQYGQHQIPIEDVLRKGLPADAAVWRSYFRRQIEDQDFSSLVTAWKWLLSRGYADDRLTNEYVRFLLQNQHPEAAAQAWASYAGSRDRAYPATNRVFNGDFEVDPAPSPFDWTLDPTPGARFDFDRQTVHSGARALRVQFDGTQNLTSLGVHQSVFLTPGRYRFSAYVRARDLSTDEGVAFRVADEQAPNRLSFTTEAVLGTTDWKLVQHLFQAPPGTGLVEIRLVRASSLRFDNLIKGVLWVDQVSIQPER